MSIPINYQREQIKKYYNLLVEEFIKDSKHKNFNIIFQDFEKPLHLGHCVQNQQTTIIDGVIDPNSTTYKYEIQFWARSYKNEDELRGVVVHEFTHHYLYSIIKGKHDHDDRFYSQMESLESWFDKKQGLSPRVDKSHDRDQYVGNNNSDTKDKKNICPECFLLSPQHFPQCYRGKTNSGPTKNTTDSQKVAEFGLLKNLLKNSKNLVDLEKYYQAIQHNPLYFNQTINKNNKSEIDILYQTQKGHLQPHSNNQSSTGNANSLHKKNNGFGADSTFWLYLAGATIILVGIICYLLGKETVTSQAKKKKQ